MPRYWVRLQIRPGGTAGVRLKVRLTLRFEDGLCVPCTEEKRNPDRTPVPADMVEKRNPDRTPVPADMVEKRNPDRTPVPADMVEKRNPDRTPVPADMVFPPLPFRLF